MHAWTLSSPPLNQLGRMGDARRNPDGWPDESVYQPERLGLNEEYVPALIRIGRLWADPGFDPGDESFWAPIHAWRMLGELRAVEAARPLLEITDVLARRHDDWYLVEYPRVFGLIGASAVAPLASLLADQRRMHGPRGCAADCLANIARRHPESRSDVVAVLCDQLTMFPLNSPELNACLIAALLDIGAAESAELMQRAFTADRVNEAVVGRWPDVQREIQDCAADEVRDATRTDKTPEPPPWPFSFLEPPAGQPNEAQRKQRKKRRPAMARRGKTAAKAGSRKPR